VTSEEALFFSKGPRVSDAGPDIDQLRHDRLERSAGHAAALIDPQARTVATSMPDPSRDRRDGGRCRRRATAIPLSTPIPDNARA
jgi:hypothetical protein